jgi:hypothetical protein
MDSNDGGFLLPRNELQPRNIGGDVLLYIVLGHNKVSTMSPYESAPASYKDMKRFKHVR